MHRMGRYSILKHFLLVTLCVGICYVVVPFHRHQKVSIVTIPFRKFTTARIFGSDNDNGSAIQSKSSCSAPKKVYYPKSKFGDQQTSKDSRLSTSSKKTFSSTLSAPQLLVRYKVPKIKTSIKLELENLQSTYAKQGLATTSIRDSHIADSKQILSRQSREYSPPGGIRQHSALSTSKYNASPTGTVGKGISTRGKGVSGRDADRRGGGGDGKQKFSSCGDNSKWSHKTREIDEDDLLVTRDGISSTESGMRRSLEEFGVLGEERGLVAAGLRGLPNGVLAGMDKEMTSLEDIQLALYGEYGIKAPLVAIKRRIDDEKFEHRKKRTGKTRREKAKARNSARFPDLEVPVYLPEHGEVSVIDLASQLGISAGEILRHLMLQEGMLLSINSSLQVPVARKLAEQFRKAVLNLNQKPSEKASSSGSTTTPISTSTHKEAKWPVTCARPPVVAVMGHVDHGKTTLLDRIRSTKVALGEAGGITQALSAFQVNTSATFKSFGAGVCADADLEPGARTAITFMDTPGHAAFRAMRQRGARLTDIVVLVVAADDGVMEQTKESIEAARSAGCPIVVAITKYDKAGADAEGVMAQLMREGVVVEELGGDCQCCVVSSVTGVGVAELLDKIALQAEVMGLETRLDAPLEATVLEARKDKGLGVVVTAVLREGTLRVGDIVVAGAAWGRVKRLISDSGAPLQLALPSVPIQIVGMNAFPSVGEALSVASNEGDAQEVTAARARLAKLGLADMASTAAKSGAASFIAESSATVAHQKVTKVPVVIKCDVAGSMEAIVSALPELQHRASDSGELGRADLVYAAVGEVTSFDVNVAAAAGATVLAFGVSSAPSTADEARSSGVEIRSYSVIYDLLNDLGKKIKETVAPHFSSGNVVGRMVVKKVFSLGKGGKVAGCAVSEGSVSLNCKVRILREGSNIPVFVGDVAGLKVGKDAVNEVSSGSDCGLSVLDFSLFEDGDVIECFVQSKK